MAPKAASKSAGPVSGTSVASTARGSDPANNDQTYYLIAAAWSVVPLPIVVYCIYSAEMQEVPYQLPALQIPDTGTLIGIQLGVLWYCQMGSCSEFAARKICHAASGLMMLCLNPYDFIARYFVYSVVVGSLIMTWLPFMPFRFRYIRQMDIGVTVYLIVVFLFFYLQVPLHIIRPVFFADPAGAVIGRALSNWDKTKRINPKWIGSKTIGGTMAVFIVAFLSLSFGKVYEKLGMAIVIAIVEGLSQDFDNLLIFVVTMIFYQLYHTMGPGQGMDLIARIRQEL